jgi:tetratricopeptide (TPR) repeat protein
MFQSRSDKLFEQGMNYMNQENYLEAIKLFSQVIEIDGSAGSAGAHINRGIAYGTLAKGASLGSDLWEDFFKNSIDDLTKAINIFQVKKSDKNALANVYFKRANTYLFSYKYEEAIDDLNEAIKLIGNNPAYYINRGFIYCERLRNASAGLKDFSKALEISETSIGYIFRSWANFDLGNTNKAKDDFYSALRLDPNARNSIRYLPPNDLDVEFAFDKQIQWENFKKNL